MATPSYITANDLDRWGVVSLKIFSSSGYATARDELVREIQGQTDPELRKQWWNKLYVFIRDHTRFSEDEWLFTNDEIENWRSVLAALTIEDSVIRGV